MPCKHNLNFGRGDYSDLNIENILLIKILKAKMKYGRHCDNGFVYLYRRWRTLTWTWKRGTSTVSYLVFAHKKHNRLHYYFTYLLRCSFTRNEYALCQLQEHTTPLLSKIIRNKDFNTFKIGGKSVNCSFMTSRFTPAF